MQLIGTENELTVPVSGTGSAGMETCFVNLIEPGDRVLVLINGVFGTRMEDVASRLGAKVESLNYEWGTVVDLNSVAEKLAETNYDLVAMVHAETSTGVCNPVEDIGTLVQQNGALYLVDCVTSLGGMEVKMDNWNIDALYSGTQKCLSCPPGLSPVSFSEKAVNKLSNRNTKVPNWYLDLSMITNYWSGNTVCCQPLSAQPLGYSTKYGNVIIESFSDRNRQHSDPSDKYNKLFQENEDVMLYKSAIGPHKQTLSMHISKRTDSSSILPIGINQSSIFPGTEESHIQNITVAPLNHFIKSDNCSTQISLPLDSI